RTPAAAAVPHDVGEAEMLHAERSGDSRGGVALGRERGEAVDILDLYSGIVGGLENRLAAEDEFRHRRAAALVVGGLADPDDRDLVLDRVLAHRVLCLIASLGLDVKPLAAAVPPATPFGRRSRPL